VTKIRTLKGANQSDIREHNQLTIIRLIRDYGPLSQTEIVKLTGLSKAAVSVLIREFLERGLVEPAGAGQSSVGPKPRLLRFRGDYRYVIGIDLSDPHYRAALVDLRGQILEPRISGTAPHDENGLLSTVCEIIDTLLDRAQQRGCTVGGIGIAISGLVDHQRGMIYRSTVLQISDMPLQAEIEKRYQLPVRVDGDVNVRLVAEQGCDEEDWTDRNVIYVYVGTGIGAGLYLKGGIYRGQSGLVGEIGHIPVVADGPTCVCGRRGCLEAVASWSRLPELARELGFNGGREVTAEHVVRAAYAGDPVAHAACAELAANLGEGLAILANILNPDLIILGGNIADAPGVFYPLLRQNLSDRAIKPVGDQVELRFSRAGADAGLVGTAGLLLPVILMEQLTG